MPGFAERGFKSWGTFSHSAFNLIDNLIKIANRQGAVTEYQYDVLNRMVKAICGSTTPGRSTKICPLSCMNTSGPEKQTTREDS